MVIMMTEQDEEQKKLAELRKKKAAELLKQHHNGEAAPDLMKWRFRSSNNGFFEICQYDNMIAATSDPNWAALVCDLLNSLELHQEANIDG